MLKLDIFVSGGSINRKLITVHGYKLQIELM